MSKIRKEPNAKAAERIRRIRADNHLSQEVFAEQIKKSVSSVKEYENGKRTIPQEVAERLVSLYGYVPDYWTGVSDARTWEQAELEQADAEISSLTEYEHRTAEARARRVDFFSICGYRYEEDTTAAFDFAAVVAPDSTLACVSGPHKLSPYSGDEPPTYFSTPELEALTARIKYMIDYECYRKRLKGESYRGND